MNDLGIGAVAAISLPMRTPRRMGLEGLRVKVAIVCAPAGKTVATVSAAELSAVITAAMQALRQSAESVFPVVRFNDFLRKRVWRSPASVKMRR